MKDRKKRKNILLTALLLIGCFAVGLVGGTLAYYSDEQTLKNPFTVGSAQVSLNEDFNPLSSFLPGETVDKIAHFENRGSTDLYLRMIDPMSTVKWNPAVDDKGQPLDTNKVTIGWTASWNSNWVAITSDTGENYYYYKKILKAGDNTPDIIESLKLSEEVSNDRHGPDYSDKTFYLDLIAEAVSIQEGIAEAEWNVKPTVESDGTIIWEKVSSTQ